MRQKAIDLHRSVNHKYGDYDYSLHLDAVEAVHQQFKDEVDLDIELSEGSYKIFVINDYITTACYFHDTMEDCRVTFNDLKSIIMQDEICKIVYALTNEKGKTRAERANDKYYEGIRNTPGASFVKMCDRIANVRFSKMMGSSMFNKYKQENEKFLQSVDADRFPKMKQCLINLFEQL